MFCISLSNFDIEGTPFVVKTVGNDPCVARENDSSVKEMDFARGFDQQNNFAPLRLPPPDIER
jgi:hypothetical protein